MGGVASTVRGFSTAIDFLKDFNQRSEFAKKFFNDQHDLAPLALGFLMHCEPTLWSLILVFSKEFRRFFGDARQRSLICEEDMRQMYQYLIIDPISKMQWFNKVKEIIQNYPITDQGNLGICWSHAIATAIYLSQSRIVGRPVDNFLTIRQRLLDEFGYDGQNPVRVMKRVLPRYKLHFQHVYPDELRRIIWNGRVCVASFYLNGIQWYNFSKFFNDPEKKKLVITAEDLNRKPTNEELQGQNLESGGHAVVLIDVREDSWTFINSWGEQWADNGQFRVHPKAMRVTFYDVFWYESDLTQREIRLFQSRGNEALEKFYEIVAGIDIIIEDKKNSLYDLGNKLLFILRFCSEVVKKNGSDSIPNSDEIREILNSIVDENGQIISSQDDDGNDTNLIQVKEDHSVVINGKEISAKDIDVMTSFLAVILTMNIVDEQLKELSDNFWRET